MAAGEVEAGWVSWAADAAKGAVVKQARGGSAPPEALRSFLSPSTPNSILLSHVSLPTSPRPTRERPNPAMSTATVLAPALLAPRRVVAAVDSAGKSVVAFDGAAGVIRIGGAGGGGGGWPKVWVTGETPAGLRAGDGGDKAEEVGVEGIVKKG